MIQQLIFQWLTSRDPQEAIRSYLGPATRHQPHVSAEASSGIYGRPEQDQVSSLSPERRSLHIHTSRNRSHCGMASMVVVSLCCIHPFNCVLLCCKSTFSLNPEDSCPSSEKRNNRHGD